MSDNTKQCSVCKIDKQYSLFPLRSGVPQGTLCKECRNAKLRNNRKEKKPDKKDKIEIPVEIKKELNITEIKIDGLASDRIICKKCDKHILIQFFPRDKSGKIKGKKCKECIAEEMRERRKKNLIADERYNRNGYYGSCGYLNMDGVNKIKKYVKEINEFSNKMKLNDKKIIDCVIENEKYRKIIDERSQCISKCMEKIMITKDEFFMGQSEFEKQMKIKDEFILFQLEKENKKNIKKKIEPKSAPIIENKTEEMVCQEKPKIINNIILDKDEKKDIDEEKILTDKYEKHDLDYCGDYNMMSGSPSNDKGKIYMLDDNKKLFVNDDIKKNDYDELYVVEKITFNEHSEIEREVYKSNNIEEIQTALNINKIKDYDDVLLKREIENKLVHNKECKSKTIMLDEYEYEKEIYTNPEKYKIYADNESYIPDYNHYLRNFEYNNRCDCTTKWVEIGYHYKILRWVIDDN